MFNIDLWVLCIYFAVIWQMKMSIFTIYLHRNYAHKGLINISPKLDFFYRWFAWLMGYCWPDWQRHWCTVHRIHHRFSDTERDPHSPYFYTFRQLMDPKNKLEGNHYKITPEEMLEFAGDVPVYTDKSEEFFRKYPNHGKYLFHALNLILFGPVAFVLSVITLYVCRKFSVIHNYASHKIGYRIEPNKDPVDKSINIFPLGIVWSGEEFGSNHHNNPGSAKFSRYWFEFDLGWVWIKILMFFKLIELNPHGRHYGAKS